jgi:DNA-binding transcriptional LysR family regulator
MLPLRDGPFRWTKLVDDPYVLAVGRRGRYAAVADATSIDALATTPVVEFLHSDNHIADWLRLHGLSYRVIHRSDDNGTVMALVAAGIGVAVVPWLTTSRRDDVRLRVLEDVPPRQLAITWHEARPTNAILDQFIRHAPAIATRLSHQIRREVPLT